MPCISAKCHQVSHCLVSSTENVPKGRAHEANAKSYLDLCKESDSISSKIGVDSYDVILEVDCDDFLN